MTYQINVFISHSWAYSNHYNTLASWIFHEPWNVEGVELRLTDLSVPRDNPIHNAPTATALRNAIFAQISASNVVVIPTGMYANYSNWIQKEIDGANIYQKPILAVDPWGAQRKSLHVKSAASGECGWNKQSVMNEIWRLYRI